MTGASIDDWGRSDVSVATRTELVAQFGRQAFERASRTGLIVRMTPGTWAPATHATSLLARAEALRLWTGGIVSGIGALALTGVRLGRWDADPVLVALSSKTQRRGGPAWADVRRVGYTPPTVSRGRAVLAAPEYALLEAVRGIDECFVMDAVWRTLQDTRTALRRVRAALERVTRVPKRRTIERAVTYAENGITSFLERESHETAFFGRDFAHLVPQHRVVVEGQLYILDWFDPSSRIAIEVDGATWHNTPDAWQHDRRRDADLASVGIATVRFTYKDITTRPWWCRSRAAEAMAARALTSASAQRYQQHA